MNEDDIDKYEQIRSIAGRNWMKGASVSLAKLDQVKAKVYNMGFADSKDLKTRTARIRAATEEQPATEPPLSKLSIQRNAWGSNTSIPDLIRNQSEKQRIRPESAKQPSKTRPLSGKPVRRRPHSAKEFGKPPVHPSEGGKGDNQPAIGIRGAKYDPSERPPDGAHMHAVTFGWVAPPGGLSEAQSDKVPPPPPRGSPDFEQILQSEGPDGFLNGESEALVNNLLTPRDAADAERSPRLLRRPTPEPIHVQLSLPQADEDEEEEDDYIDTERLLQDGAFEAAPPSITSELVSVTDIASTAKSSDDITCRADFEQELNNILQDECSRAVSKVLRDDASQVSGASYKAPVAKKASVAFDEDRNITVDITPRNRDTRAEDAGQDEGQKSRSYSGRPELRRVKSRTDSGMTFKSTKVIERRHTCSDLENKAANQNEPALSISGTDHRKSRRPKSSRSRINTVGVHYIEEVEGEEGERPKSRPQPRSDVETMMSRLAMSDQEEVTSSKGQSSTLDQSESEDGQPGSRSSGGDATKLVSSSSKNYYELARQGKTGANTNINDNAQNEKVKKVVVTTKMISLAEDREVQETKSVSVVDIPVHQTHRLEHVPTTHTRPPSARHKHQQVKSKQSDTRNREESADDEPPSPTPSPPPSRPESRLENREEVKTHATMLKKRRVISAPSMRKRHTESKPKNKSLPGCDKRAVHSHTSISSINSRASSADARRANAAVRALKEDKSMAGRFSKKKDQSVVELGEPIEIWTRRSEVLVETEGVRECQELQDRLIEGGVPVSLETLTRALLPPTEYGFKGASYNSNAKPSLPAYSSGLLSRPSTWLPEEYKRLQQAEKAVRMANASLLEQEREERRLFQGPRKSQKKKVKGKSKGRRRRAMSAV